MTVVLEQPAKRRSEMNWSKWRMRLLRDDGVDAPAEASPNSKKDVVAACIPRLRLGLAFVIKE